MYRRWLVFSVYQAHSSRNGQTSILSFENKETFVPCPKLALKQTETCTNQQR